MAEVVELRRDARNAEIAGFVRVTWQRSMHVKHLGRDPSGEQRVKAGAVWLAPRMWSLSHKGMIKHILGRKGLHVEVWEVDGALMGWVAWEWDSGSQMTTIHFVYVAPDGRRCGLGSKLLRPLLTGKYTTTHMTTPGAYLLSALASKEAVPRVSKRDRQAVVAP